MNLNFFHIDKLITVQSFECSHDLPLQKLPLGSWILLYTAKGTIEISTGTELFTLHRDEIAFHQTNSVAPVNLLCNVSAQVTAIAFQTISPEMLFFQGKTLLTDARERSILAELAAEALSLFSQQETTPFGAEQMVQLHLQHLLIHLTRRFSFTSENPSVFPLKKDTEIFQHVTNYMRNHLSTRLTIEQLCRENMIGRAHLQKIFHTESGCGVIEYFLNLKIETAKELIANQKMNFTQISEVLGYSSIHYFSRQFKKQTGMTPSEYAALVELQKNGI